MADKTFTTGTEKTNRHKYDILKNW